MGDERGSARTVGRPDGRADDAAPLLARPESGRARRGEKCGCSGWWMAGIRTMVGLGGRAARVGIAVKMELTPASDPEALAVSTGCSQNGRSEGLAVFGRRSSSNW